MLIHQCAEYGYPVRNFIHFCSEIFYFGQAIFISSNSIAEDFKQGAVRILQQQFFNQRQSGVIVLLIRVVSQ